MKWKSNLFRSIFLVKNSFGEHGKRCVILCFLFLLLSCDNHKNEVVMEMEKYEVLTIDQVKSKFQKKKSEQVKHIEYNYSILYRYEDGTYLLVPNDPAYEDCIVFYDKEIMDSIIESHRYPVEIKRKNIYTEHQDEIVGLEVKKNEIFRRFFRSIDMPEDSARFSIEEINNIGKHIWTKYDIKGKIKKELSFDFYLYLSFAYKYQFDCEVLLEKEPGALNIYWIPKAFYIKDNVDYEIPIRYVIEDIPDQNELLFDIMRKGFDKKLKKSLQVEDLIRIE